MTSSPIKGPTPLRLPTDHRNTTPDNTPIYICYFGITRSLTFTIDSIKTNIILPTSRNTTAYQYCHVFDIPTIDNPRSGESGSLIDKEYLLLDADWLETSTLPIADLDKRLDKVREFGDDCQDDFRSLRNLVYQLYSLETVTQAALDAGAEICIFCRPDLLYHDDFSKTLADGLKRHKQNESYAFIPNWQNWGGMNDRFALCVGRNAIAAYGLRWRMVHDFLRDTCQPLRGERLLSYSLMRSPSLKIRKISIRASRVRIGGVLKNEDFRSETIIQFYLQLGRISGRVKRLIPRKILATPFLQRLSHRLTELLINRISRK